MATVKETKQSKPIKQFDIKPRPLPKGFDADNLFITVDYTQKYIEYMIPAAIVAVFCSEMFEYGYKVFRFTLYNPIQKSWFIMFERISNGVKSVGSIDKRKNKQSRKK